MHPKFSSDRLFLSGTPYLDLEVDLSDVLLMSALANLPLAVWQSSLIWFPKHWQLELEEARVAGALVPARFMHSHGGSDTGRELLVDGSLSRTIFRP